MKSTRGFTLIELLVVIAIIAILMGVLMPGLQKVREQARFMACRSNLRNYALVGRMYADDNNGNFPRSFNWLFGAGGTNCNWHDESKNLDTHPELAGSVLALSEELPEDSRVPDVRDRGQDQELLRLQWCDHCRRAAVRLHDELLSQRRRVQLRAGAVQARHSR